MMDQRKLASCIAYSLRVSRTSPCANLVTQHLNLALYALVAMGEGQNPCKDGLPDKKKLCLYDALWGGKGVHVSTDAASASNNTYPPDSVGVCATSSRLPQWIPLPTSASTHYVDNEAQTTEEMMGREQCEKMLGTKMSSLVSKLQEMTDRLANLEGRNDTAGSASRSGLRAEAYEPRAVHEAFRGEVAVKVPGYAETAPIMSSLQDLKDQHQAHRAALKARRREDRQQRLNSSVNRDTAL